MADIIASAGASSNDHKLRWDLHFDDVADTVTITANHTHLDDSPDENPQQAEITVILNNSVEITVDLLTGLLSTGGNFSQTSPGIMLNVGSRTRTGVKLKVSADRAGIISFTTQYLPPA